MTNNHPRGSKVAHYSNEPPLTHGSGGGGGHSQNSYANTNGVGINSSNSSHHHGHHNSHVPAHSPTSSNTSAAGSTNRRGNKLSLEPLLMSPEINSIMGGDDARSINATA